MCAETRVGLRALVVLVIDDAFSCCRVVSCVTDGRTSCLSDFICRLQGNGLREKVYRVF